MGKRGGCGFVGWLLVLVILGLLAGGIFLVVRSKMHKSDDDGGSVPDSPGQIQKKYSNALNVAFQFFDVQKAGKLNEDKIKWRGDSALDDGSTAKLDLSKGLYDAGDHMKFGFPMAFTATVLSWSILEYGDQMEAANQLATAQDSLKWITDFLIHAHPSDNVLYVQVGDPVADHKCWNRPEDMTEKRPVFQVNASSPGSDVAAEAAAAMASASLVFKKKDSDYSNTLLKHAKQLFSFADKYKGSYCDSIPGSATYYNSTGYGDELLWAASWLYHATGEKSYLQYVTGQNGNDFADWGNPTWFSWDNKLPGTHVLLARLTLLGQKDTSNAGLQQYRETAEAVMCGLIPDSPTATSSRTDGGLIWVSDWNALQQPVAAAFLASVYGDYMLTSGNRKFSCSGTTFKASDLKKFARSQADYVLGDNPMKMSYLVGYGDKFPQFVHHRGASIPDDASTGCSDGWKWLESKDPNPNVAMGALVGGPFKNDSYIDDRNNTMQTEPSTYNSAVMVGLLSGLVATSSVVQSLA
ncbi:Endoglucanase 2 [Linum grandiflorum]